MPPRVLSILLLLVALAGVVLWALWRDRATEVERTDAARAVPEAAPPASGGSALSEEPSGSAGGLDSTRQAPLPAPVVPAPAPATPTPPPSLDAFAQTGLAITSDLHAWLVRVHDEAAVARHASVSLDELGYPTSGGEHASSAGSFAIEPGTPWPRVLGTAPDGRTFTARLNGLLGEDLEARYQRRGGARFEGREAAPFAEALDALRDEMSERMLVGKRRNLDALVATARGVAEAAQTWGALPPEDGGPARPAETIGDVTWADLGYPVTLTNGIAYEDAHGRYTISSRSPDVLSVAGYNMDHDNLVCAVVVDGGGISVLRDGLSVQSDGTVDC